MPRATGSAPQIAAAGLGAAAPPGERQLSAECLAAEPALQPDGLLGERTREIELRAF